ncbi:Eco57I restriction-modification methylase domain-containing protein [Acinetobacter dispersus]|uniref:Eco57I restriction-modification methylase domain-containing protein n=1 Tax=Acinetobacter dispersus TaxID=70348 RepID=UPI001F4B71C8|nr:Eco57I restriction-modification methylase domain-containing protein [Acinetobacter dispersus]MCH7390895.1 Eco57I restriction-modification methylase domain-containing protein [Acinetobacter dispersus]
MQHIQVNQDQFLSQEPLTKRKELGQYFTGSKIANFMAKLATLKISSREISILDAGAGAGILGIASAYEAVQLGHTKIQLICYERDVSVLPLLQQHLEVAKEDLKKQEITFKYEIRSLDFILTPPEEYFDLCCINPPYFKYSSKNSPYAQSTKDLFRGDPNIYALFVARSLDKLKTDGELIFITPRSFTNGLYFKNFRKYLIQNSSIKFIHIFKSRKEAFKDTEVLQENVIFKLKKDKLQQDIYVSSSYGIDDLDQSDLNIYTSELIIDNQTSESFIRIPEAKKDAEILHLVEQWPSSFEELGYFISTGPVVEYRAGSFVEPNNEANSIPLINAHNIKDLEVQWTGNHPKDRKFNLIDNFSKWVVGNSYYVIMRRISSKDEKRRIGAAVYTPSDDRQEFVALENHINFIGNKSRELSKEEAYGLALILRSKIFDTYFRCISGNTQINATEIKTLKLPSLQLINQIGSKWLNDNIDEDIVNTILERHLNYD